MRTKLFAGCMGLVLSAILGAGGLAADAGSRPNVTISPAVAPLQAATTLTIMGSGFAPGQQLLILIDDKLGVPTALPLEISANENGAWATQWQLGDYVGEKIVTDGLFSVKISDAEYHVLASYPVGLVDNTKDPKQWPEWAKNAGIEHKKESGPVTVLATVSKVEDEGRTVTFKTEKGEEVTSRLSSSRSKVKQGDKTLSRSDIKEGMSINITYMADGNRNEPSEIDILK